MCSFFGLVSSCRQDSCHFIFSAINSLTCEVSGRLTIRARPLHVKNMDKKPTQPEDLLALSMRGKIEINVASASVAAIQPTNLKWPLRVISGHDNTYLGHDPPGSNRPARPPVHENMTASAASLRKHRLRTGDGPIPVRSPCGWSRRSHGGPPVRQSANGTGDVHRR